MSTKLKKIAATVSSVLMICSGVVKISPNTKAMFPYPQPGVPAYAVPVGYGQPQSRVPAYVIQINTRGYEMEFTLPYPPLVGVVNIPQYYQFVKLVDSIGCTRAIIPITTRNGSWGYEFQNRFYVINRY